MANAGAIQAANAYVTVSLDDNPLTRGLRQTAAKVRAWGRSIASVGASFAALGAAITTPLTAAAASFAESGSALLLMSKRTGVSVESLSELKYAAQQSGVEFDQLENALKKLSVHFIEAAKGGDAMIDTFAILKIKVSELKNLSPEQQFIRVAEALNKVGNPALKASLAVSLFGKSGTGLIPMLGNMEALREEARALGIVMSGEAAASAYEFQRAWGQVSAQLKSLAGAFGSAIAPVLTDVMAHVTPILRAAINWVRENKALVATVFSVGAAIGALGATLFVLGKAVAVVVAGFALVGSAVMFWFNPLFILARNLASLGYLFVTETDVGKRAFGSLAELAVGAFNSIKATATDAFGGISDAIRAGDLGLAARIAWAGVKLEFTKGVDYLLDIWDEWRDYFLDVFTDVTASLQAVWVETTSFLFGDWEAAVQFMADFWDATLQLIADGWEGLKGLLSDGWQLLVDVWEMTTDHLGNVWDATIGRLIGSFSDFIGYLKPAMAFVAALIYPVAAAIGFVAAKVAQMIPGVRGLTEEEAAQRDERLKAVQEAADAEKAGRPGARDEARAARAEELEAMSDEFQRLVGRAAEAASNAKSPLGKKPPDFAEPLGNIRQKVDVAGGFNAFGVAGLGAGKSLTERLVDINQQQADLLKKIDGNTKGAFTVR